MFNKKENVIVYFQLIIYLELLSNNYSIFIIKLCSITHIFQYASFYNLAILMRKNKISRLNIDVKNAKEKDFENAWKNKCLIIIKLHSKEL